MKKNLCVIFLLFTTLSFAVATNIQGKIVDSQTNTPISSVRVGLHRQDRSFVSGVSTDKDGIFNISVSESGKYALRISLIGYKELVKFVEADEKSIDLGIIPLTEDTKMLGEVEVVGQGTQMKLEADKKVFNVDQNIVNAGGSASDVLKSIPSVTVDQEGNISLRKDSNVEVWINGKPSGLTADNRAQVLEQMPAESIESVEIMTNPSAKFSPEGTAGIINFVMKKNRKAGYFGSFSSGIMYPDKGKITPIFASNINYNNPKVDAYANIGYRAMHAKGTGITDRYTIVGNDTTTLLHNDRAVTTGYGGIFMRGGIEFHLDDKNTIGFSGFGMTGKGISNSDANFTLLDKINNVTMKQYNRSNNGDGERQSLNVNIDYKHNFDKKGSNITSTFSFSTHTRKMNNTITEYEALSEKLNFDQDITGTNKDISFKTDYIKQLNEKSKLEAGWSSIFNNRFSSSNAVNNKQKTAILSYANDFDYQEQVHAIYASHSNRFEKIAIQAGLRAEYLNKKTTLTTPLTPTQTITTTPNVQLFPSLYFSYTIEKNSELQLNFTRRINRPRGRQINPFKDFTDSTNITYGNPDLKPEYTSALELNYMQSWDNHSLSTSMYYRFTDNVIKNVQFIHNKTMENTYTNIAKIQNTGVELIAKNKLFKILQLTSSINVYYSNMNASQYQNPFDATITTTIPKQSTFSWIGNCMANFALSKTFFGQITGEYVARSLMAQGTEDPRYRFDMGLRKTFFDKKLNINVSVNDLFNTSKQHSTSEGTGFYQVSDSRFRSRMVILNFTYNFGNTKPKPADMKKKMNPSDINMDITE